MSELPATLEPVTVGKPWGREIWYSGIEARGESRVWTDAGTEPLSRYLAHRGRAEPVLLLKALEPSSGNLYLELHDTKAEVYIVDRIDGGRDRMLLGACPDRRAALGDAAFRFALLEAARRAEAGAVGMDEVEAFMNPIALRPGDAVTIPPGMPHCLLRGVHVIEFQTPLFERRILAASQPVETQLGWDSSEAVAAMDLSGRPKVTRAGARTGKRRAQIVARAPGFTVTRFRLEPDSTFAVPPWSVGWIVHGEVRAAGRKYASRTAFVAPETVALQAVDEAEVLLASES